MSFGSATRPGESRWACALCMLLLPALLAAPLGSRAEGAGNGTDPARVRVRSGDVTLEVSAPREDILRIRVGHPKLPEDASWAVAAERRAPRVRLEQARQGRWLSVRTARLQALIDTRSLAIDVRDSTGAELLQDAPDALRFERGGYTLRKRLPEHEHYFGLGDKSGPLDRRGQSLVLWNSDAYGFGPATDPLYKSVPFFLAANERGRAFGFFLDDTWRTSFDFGRRDRSVLQISAAGGPVDYYLIAGPEPKAVVQGYAWLTGTAPLAPLWSLGFAQSHWGYHTQAQAQAVADRLRADHVPADVLYLDIDYLDRNRVFTVDRQRFPDLPGLVRHLDALGMHLVLITDLHVPRIPDGSYEPYASGAAAGVFVRNPDGSEYVGKVWPGECVFPDFTRPLSRRWWGEQYRGLVGLGVHGFWNDMNEPSVFDVPDKTMPLDTVHRIEEPGFQARNASHAEIHNVFGMLNSRATYEGNLRLAPAERPFVLTRASYAGGQRYAATWTGDNSSSWEQLRLSVPQLISLGLSGFAYAGDDIGGFTGSRPPAGLLTRWFEIGAFNPLFRDHYDIRKNEQEIWVDGPVQEDIRRRYVEERYRLLPYLYTLAEQNSRTGLPIMRPVFLEFPAELARADQGEDDSAAQFMLGGALLIAPPASWESPAPYAITLPSDGWYDYWSGQRLGSAHLTETPRLERLPVYVRPGTILPQQPLVQSAMQRPSGALRLQVYPGPDCEGSVYLDDGHSFAYREGQYLRQAFRCHWRNGALEIDIDAREGRFLPWWSGYELIVHGIDAAAAGAVEQGRALPVHAEDGALRVEVADAPAGGHVTITQAAPLTGQADASGK